LPKHATRVYAAKQRVCSMLVSRNTNHFVATTRKKVQDEMQFCSQLQKLKTRT